MRSSLVPRRDALNVRSTLMQWTCIPGHGSVNKGITPEYLAQACDFFDRALTLDPGNIEAMVGVAQARLRSAFLFVADDRAGYLRRPRRL